LLAQPLTQLQLALGVLVAWFLLLELLELLDWILFFQPLHQLAGVLVVGILLMLFRTAVRAGAVVSAVLAGLPHLDKVMPEEVEQLHIVLLILVLAAAVLIVRVKMQAKAKLAVTENYLQLLEPQCDMRAAGAAALISLKALVARVVLAALVA
jgi:cytochrome b561